MGKLVRSLLLISGLALLVVPALGEDLADEISQDDAVFAAFDSDFGSDSMASFVPAAPEVTPLSEVTRLISLADAQPLSKNQEKALKKLYDAEVKESSKAFKKRFGASLKSALASPGSGSAEQITEVSRLYQELTDKIVASLQLDQRAALRRYQSEQLRQIRLSRFYKRMEQAGVFLTSGQQPEIENLFSRESRLRTLIIIEAKGPTYYEQVRRLEAQTKERILDLLDGTQKEALVEFNTKPKTAS